MARVEYDKCCEDGLFINVLSVLDELAASGLVMNHDAGKNQGSNVLI